jgi:hypothetical protein
MWLSGRFYRRFMLHHSTAVGVTLAVPLRRCISGHKKKRNPKGLR